MTGATIVMLFQGLLFAKSYGTSSSEPCYNLAQTTDGGFVLVGEEWSGMYTGIIAKTDAAGNLLWAKHIVEAATYNRTYGVVPTGDNGALLAGVVGFGGTPQTLLLFRMDSAGNVLWTRGIEGLGTSLTSVRVMKTRDGGYLLGGTADAFGNWTQAVLVKVDSAGAVQWARDYGGPSEDHIGDYGGNMIQTQDGGYAFACYNMGLGIGTQANVLVVKTDSMGNPLWATAIGSDSSDFAGAILELPGGGYAILSWAYGFELTQGGASLVLSRLDSGGNLLWNKAYGGFRDELLKPGCAIFTQDNGILVAGYTSSAGAGSYDFWIMRLDTAGTLSWSRTFGTEGSEWPRGVIQCSDGNIAVAGGVKGNAGVYDFGLLKMASDGSYSGCVSGWTPSVSDVSSWVGVPVSPAGGFRSLTTVSPTLTLEPWPFTTTDLCAPLYIGESEGSGLPGSGITVFSVSGGALFNSTMALAIRIYSSSGRLVHFGELKKGENRINLGRGVYFWKAGEFRGKVVVR